MNIGVSLFSARHPIDPAVVAQKAEALGFDSLWLGEHPVMPVHSASPAPGSSGGSIPDFYSRLVDPFVALARASAVTTTLKLGTGVTLVPERNPLLLAKEVATSDRHSGDESVGESGAQYRPGGRCGWLGPRTALDVLAGATRRGAAGRARLSQSRRRGGTRAPAIPQGCSGRGRGLGLLGAACR